MTATTRGADWAATRRRRARRLRLGALAGLIAAFALPAVALAHPLGNFTINHYAGIRVMPGEIHLDLVLDRAEIPTFQERLRLDVDGDGEVSEEEAHAGRDAECGSFDHSIALKVAGSILPLELTASGLSFPPGAGGLSTMRLVCEFRAALSAPLVGPTDVAFLDSADSDRLGWREITVEGDGVSIASAGGELLSASPSSRLTAYPKDLLTQPLSIRAVAFTASPGGAALPPLVVPDADPVAQPGAPPSGEPTAGGGPGVTAGGGAVAATSDAAVPGGVGSGDIPSVFRQPDLSPTVWILALATAVALGAGHALTPGHGKTLMAAYLVGTRGTTLHAAGLGLSVTVSHTIGILVLAALVIGAQGVLPPDVVARTTPTIAAVAIVGIGGWMLVSEIRRRRRAAALAAGHANQHQDHHDGHDHEAGAGHQGGEAAQHLPAGAPHSHGAIAHTHLPPSASTITWRGLFLLGLAGGIIPSTNALLILLGTIAAGRAAFGFVLVVAFGLGMALVMAGVGLALVHARGWLERGGSPPLVRRLSAQAPLAAAILIVGLGVWLTVQAVGRPAL